MARIMRDFVYLTGVFRRGPMSWLSPLLVLVFMVPFCIITCVSNVGVGLVVVVVMVEAARRG